jgi:DNA adenine methylase
MKHASPLRYPGGKTFLASEFARILDVIGLDKPTYVEPYAGGAGAALTLLFIEQVQSIVINDYDKAIYSFWRAATEKSESFAQKIISTPVTVAQWKKQKKIYLNEHADFFDRGFATFFLNRTNRSGVMNASPIGGMDQTGNYKINARYNKNELAARVRKIGEYKDRIAVLNEDGIELTKRFLKKKDTFIYLDPPYFEKGAMLYLNHYEQNDHEKLAKLLNENASQNWILTYDAIESIKNLYPKRNSRNLPVSYRVRTPIKTHELMIFSNTTAV